MYTFRAYILVTQDFLFLVLSC